MAKDANAFLADILSSIQIIQEHMKNVDNLDSYKKNFMVEDAVERRLAIIGKALSKATKLNPEISVSHQRKIIALRHIIVHDYDIVDNDAVWSIVKVYLPVLKEEIKKYLD